jgi:hypothetical protein
MIGKGTVSTIGDDWARVIPINSTIVTPPMDTKGLTLVSGDIVAYVLFEDGTGFIIDKMRM